MSLEAFDPHQVESYRHEHESSTEWSLRKKFLMTHYQTLAPDRLFCLASCFINVECYGCRYPAGVMLQLRELAESLSADIKEHRDRIQSQRDMKFVKAGGGAEGQGEKRSLPVESDVPLARKRKKGLSEGRIQFVKEGEANPGMKLSEPSALLEPPAKSHAEHPSVTRDPAVAELYKLVMCLKEIQQSPKYHSGQMNPKELLNNALNSCQKIIKKLEFSERVGDSVSCQLLFDLLQKPVLIAEAKGHNKQLAKNAVFDKACEILVQHPHLNICQVDGRYHLQSSPVSLIGKSNMSTTASSFVLNAPFVTKKSALPKNYSQHTQRVVVVPGVTSLDLHKFILFEEKDEANRSPLNIMHRSASFNKCSLEYDFREETTLTVHCCLRLGGEVLSNVAASTQAKAKSKACAAALKSLRQKCWTVRTKKACDTEDNVGFSREDVLGSMELHSNQISGANIGCKMMQKMGWSGGGIGKTKGIEEPVTLKSAFNRQGLGLSLEQGTPPEFAAKVRDMLKQYALSEKQEDITFSPEFSKEERAIIHVEAQKLKLRNTSYGRGNDRYMVVGRKRDTSQLIDHILQHGGETSRYLLIAPGTVNSESADANDECQ